jgi:hypothetical protein
MILWKGNGAVTSGFNHILHKWSLFLAALLTFKGASSAAVITFTSLPFRSIPWRKSQLSARTACVPFACPYSPDSCLSIFCILLLCFPSMPLIWTRRWTRVYPATLDGIACSLPFHLWQNLQTGIFPSHLQNFSSFSTEFF